VNYAMDDERKPTMFDAAIGILSVIGVAVMLVVWPPGFLAVLLVAAGIYWFNNTFTRW